MTWQESDHPRDPEGRFRDRTGDWAHSAIEILTRRAHGRDLRDEFKGLAGWRHLDGGDIPVTTPDDKVLDRIYDLQGYHGHPDVVTPGELDDAIADGWTEVWRGIKPHWDDENGQILPARQLTEQFRYGDRHFPGVGIFGNGTYTTVSRREATTYTGPPGQPKPSEGLIRMAIPPDARIIDYDDLVAEWDQMSDEFAEYYAEVEMSGQTADLHPKARVLGDMGRFGAAVGYDAVRVPGMGLGDYFVVFNRSMLKVQQAT